MNQSSFVCIRQCFPLFTIYWDETHFSVDLFFDFSLPSPTIMKILQFLITITVLIDFTMTIQTIWMVCGMFLLPIMFKHFECWCGCKFFIACKAEIRFRYAFFTESCMYCIDMLTILLIISGCHRYQFASKGFFVIFFFFAFLQRQNSQIHFVTSQFTILFPFTFQSFEWNAAS